MTDDAQMAKAGSRSHRLSLAAVGALRAGVSLPAGNWIGVAADGLTFRSLEQIPRISAAFVLLNVAGAAVDSCNGT